MNDVALVYRGSTSVTGRAIAAALGITRFGKRPDERAIRCLIRWGDSRPVRGVEREVNIAGAIAVAASKTRTFAALESAGVPIPEWTTSQAAARDWDTIFSRSAHGMGGADIRVGIFPGADFYVRVVPIAREYRLHVVGGSVVRVQGKYLDNPDQSDGGLVHNYAHGWRFRAPSLQVLPERRTVAVQAVRALGLDFGAVDLIVTPEGGNVVLEVNTAPGCSPLTVSAYANALAGYLDEGGGRNE